MRALYDSKSKLDDRGIKALIAEENKFETWKNIEAVLAMSQAECGFIPMEAAKAIQNCSKSFKIDLEEMERIKSQVGHGFVPFLKLFTEACSSEGKKYVHYGVTTQNIQQTAQLYILKQVNHKILLFVADILNNLAKLAEEHASTIMPGRTHGRHAVPITYGYKVSVWISELLNTLDRIRESDSRIFQVMMGGAVGGFNAMSEHGREVQDRVAQRLGMYSMDVPSRNMNLHKLEYVFNLTLLCNTFHKIAEESYYTGIEEFNEISEPFSAGTIGSSTMPQKINPKLSKGIIANSQKLYSLVPTGLYSSVRMFEGDSSSYMLFEGILQESVELTTEVLIRANELTRGLHVNTRQMARNAELNHGLDNSEHIMMKVAELIGKDQAHELVYKLAMEQSSSGGSFRDRLMKNEQIEQLFVREEIEDLLKPGSYIGECPKLAQEMAAKARNESKLLREALFNAV